MTLVKDIFWCLVPATRQDFSVERVADDTTPDPRHATHKDDNRRLLESQMKGNSGRFKKGGNALHDSALLLAGPRQRWRIG